MIDLDRQALWLRYSLAFAIVTLFWAFLFFVFAGHVSLNDPVVAGLVGSAITQAANIIGGIATYYYAPPVNAAVSKDS